MKKIALLLAVSLFVGNAWGMEKKEEEKELAPVGAFLTDGPVELVEEVYKFLHIKNIFHVIALVCKNCDIAAQTYKTWSDKPAIELEVLASLLVDEERVASLVNMLQTTKNISSLEIKIFPLLLTDDDGRLGLGTEQDHQNARRGLETLLRGLEGVTWLKCLVVSGDTCQYSVKSDAGFLKYVPSQIEDLSVEYLGATTDEDLKHLCRCPNLKSLSLCELGGSVTGEFFEVLPNCLERLEITSCGGILPDRYLGKLFARLTNFKKLMLIAYVYSFSENTGKYLFALPTDREVELELCAGKPDEDIVAKLLETHPWMKKYLKSSK